MVQKYNKVVTFRIHYIMDSLNKYWVHNTQGVTENMRKDTLFLSDSVDILWNTLS